MYNIVHSVTVGALLHDLGKIMYRAGSVDGRPHSISGADYAKRYINDKNIIDCIQFHHRQELSQVILDNNSLAYIVYIADNISSGAGKREIEGVAADGFNKARMLESVYNLLNNRSGKAGYAPGKIGNCIKYPENTQSFTASAEYEKIMADFSKGLSGIYFKPEYINSLIDLCESCMSFIPSSTYLGQVADISLFDHSKMTAALAACIALYLNCSGRTDYKEELFEKEKSFCDEKAFCLFSIDISGIQQFIYTISSKGALKGLRSRSFYLEILLENIVDEILEVCQLSRANLLYTGGGHAYLLLPNTDETKLNVQNSIMTINKELIKRFGTGLFAACGLETCSANELMSKTRDPDSYANIFRSVSAQISAMKLRRYSPEDIRRLNSSDIDNEGRECSICGSSSDLSEYGNDTVCELCKAFADISSDLIKPDTVFTISYKKLNEKYLPLFSAKGKALFMSPMSADSAKEILEKYPGNIARIYSKNVYRTGFPLATRLWMGDYASKNDNGALKTFTELADCSEGIKRIGVLRADVDNLGAAFVGGFVRENDPENKYRYVTISRTATLSRSLSIFFKYHINSLVENQEYALIDKKSKRNLVIVYAGGDDLFIVGAWDEVLSAAIDIRKAFGRYTGGALSLSAGISFFDAKYPIALMAEETLELEERAKHNKHQNGIKDSVSLFGLEPENGYLTDKHTYNWHTFYEKVLGEKYNSIKTLFNSGEAYGTSFLYNILYLLRQAEEDKINIARLAYLLARHEPEKEADDLLKSAYKRFTASIYKWAFDSEDRKQLITALIIYVYTVRDKEEGNNNE